MRLRLWVIGSPLAAGSMDRGAEKLAALLALKKRPRTNYAELVR